MAKPVKMSFSIEELAKSSQTIGNNVPVLELISTQQKRKRSCDTNSDNNSSFDSTDSRDCCSLDLNSVQTERPKKKSRITYTNSQLVELEKYYSNQKYLLVEDRPILAERLQLSQTQIKWWFQNRRMKEKRQIKSYNGSVDMSQFVAVGKPGQRLYTGTQLHEYYSHPQYSASLPISQQTTPYTCSPLFPDIYPGHNPLYNSSSQIYHY